MCCLSDSWSSCFCGLTPKSTSGACVIIACVAVLAMDSMLGRKDWKAEERTLLWMQGVNSAPARLHRTANSDAYVEDGGRSAPNGLAGHQERPMRAGRDAYDAGPQNSNGTTVGQVLAAGAPSARPEGVQQGVLMTHSFLSARRAFCMMSLHDFNWSSSARLPMCRVPWQPCGS